jgi:autotransporter-associated beta strand protein
MHSFVQRALALPAAILLAASPLSAQIEITDSVRTFPTLTNTTVILTGKSELHITGTSNPISGSTIHLNSHDSWLWFDNIRPSTVNSSLIGQIRVNGANATHGVNVRVVQYAMGTVVTPFTNAEQPLETFTDPGFRGASKAYNLYTDYDSSADFGVMHENISSFKLRRGFMATFGTRADGTGASKVYIAQDHDVNIAAMPGNLDNAVRFVRVFPWRWVSKKGSCDVSPDVLDAAWHYNWNNDKNSTLNWEYVPIRQQRWWPAYPSNKPSVTHLLGFNEPDNPVEDSYQTLDNGSRDAAIAAWPELLQTGLRVGAPAVTDGGKWWLFDFMNKANAAGLRVDYIPVHFYQCGMSAPQLKAWLQDIWDRYQKPIWVTEFNNGANWTGCGDPSYEQNADVIASWIDMMDNTPWIERYAVYSNVEHMRFMEYSSGGLTPAGTVYRSNKSPVGYLQESYPLAVRRGIARFRFDGDTRDSSGHDNRGVSYGAPDFVTGTSGQALQLDGNHRYLRLPPGIVRSSGFTFGTWVNWDGGDGGQRIFDFGNGTEQFLYLTPGAGGQLRFGLRNNSGTTTHISTAALPTGSWQHVAVTLQGSNAKIFLNGTLQAQGTLPEPPLSGTSHNFIGKSQWSNDPLFDGRLDEVVLIDSALADDQITGLMAGIDSPFVAYWSGDVDSAWISDHSGDTNWSADAAGTIDTGMIPAANTEVHFAVGPANTTLGSDFAVDSLVVTTPSPVTIGGTHDLTIGAAGVYLGDTAGPVRIQTSGRVLLASDQTWANNSSGGLTVSSEVSGSAKLTLTGAAGVELTGNNTHSGELSIVGGASVSVPSVSSALGSASQVLMGGSGSTGALVYTGSGETTARVLTFQGGFGSPGIVLDQSGSGLLRFTSNLESIALVGKTLTLRGSTGGEGEIAGVIPNSGTTTSIVKEGTGTWTLSAANTYTGTTTLLQGTLALGHNAALGSGTLDLRGGALRAADSTPRTIGNPISLSANTTIRGTGDLLFTGTVNAGSLSKTLIIENNRTEISGVLTGSGARLKSGPGTLVLSGSNTYTGPTTVSAGTLEVVGSLSAASAVTVASGATLGGTGNIPGTVAFANGARLGWSLSGNGESAVHLTTGPAAVTAGALADLVFDAPGSTVDFTDPFWTQIHSWPLLNCSGITGTFVLGNVSADSAGRPVTGYGSFHLQHHPGGVLLFFAPVGLELPPAPTGLKAIASRNQVALSWDGSPGAAGYLVLRSTTPGGPYETIANVIFGTAYVDHSVVDGGTYYYAVSSTNPNGGSGPSAEVSAMPHPPSTFDKADNILDLDLAQSWTGGVIPTALDTARWAGLSAANGVLLGSGTTWNGIEIGATGGSVTIDGSHNLIVGNAGISMNGASHDLLIRSNLALGSGHQVWDIATSRNLSLQNGSFTRGTGSTLNIRGGGSVSAGMPGIGNDGSSGGGMLGPWASTGTGAASTYASLGAGDIVPFTGATPAAAFGWTSGNPASNNYDVAAVQAALGVSRAAHTVRYTGAAGTQTWGNSSANVTFTLHGILNAGSGTLTFAKGGTGAGTALVVGADRELVLNAANAGISIQMPIFDHASGASALTTIGSGGVTLGAANTYSGPTTVGSGTLVVSGGGTLGSGAVHVAPGAELQINKALTLAQSVTGRGTIRGAATVTLAGDLGGFAGTYIHNSTTSSTALTSTAAASRHAAYHIASSQGSQQGMLTNVAAGNPTFDFGALSGVANSLLRNGNTVTGNTTLRVGFLNTDSVFAGTIGGGGGTLALTKVGVGTLTLAGTNAYSGATRVEDGTLLLTGALNGNSPLQVLNGGRFAGTGTTNGAVTVASGGILAPGNGQGGVLTVAGTPTLENGAILEAGIGTTSSRLDLSAAPHLSGVTKIRVLPLAGFATGTYPLITGTGSINTSDFEIDDAPDGYIYQLDIIAGTLTLTIALPPVAPAGLTAAGGNTAVALQWTASPGASRYTVKRGAPGGESHETIATVPGPAFEDATAVPGSIYSYVVTAWNAAGESAASPEAVAGLLTHIHTWRYLHFGTTVETADSAGDADPDQDGINNLLEYALGSDPKTPGTGSSPRIVDSGERLTITFTRNAYALDVVMSVWVTDDPASENWREIARGTGGALFTNVIDGVSTGAPVSEAGAGATHTVEVGDLVGKNHPGHPGRFMRVMVER